MESAQTLAPNDSYNKDAVLKMLKLANYVLPEDRPGWIPPDILYDWDTCPYAYQTEEELMPAGGLHNEILTYIAEILRYFFKTRGLRFLADTFMLYRDSQGIKQRVAPDFMVIPFCHPPPSAYDLDTEPAPLAVMEITSPKSRAKDMHEKVSFYASLGIPACLVIDSITSGGILRKQVELHLWRQIQDRFHKMRSDAEGYLPVPEMKVKIKAQGQNLIFADIITGEILCDVGQMQQRIDKEAILRKQASERADKEAMLHKQAAERADKEAMLRKLAAERADKALKLARQEKQRAERLTAKLKELGISLE